jgi:twitching motility protein PilT
MSTMQIDRLLDSIVTLGASDLHISTGRPPTIRLHGSLKSLATKVIEPDDATALMKSITPEKNQAELAEVGGTDFGFSFQGRARFIPNKLLSFQEIGLPPIVEELCRRPRGLFLVTGPTGSGKSTTLASMVNWINELYDRHIVTIEDPIEYYHYHKKSVVNQREVGQDVPSFSEALRRVLRSDPDVILVGEMRDLETIESAIRAAETGHLVFATLHTSGAASTINRVIDAFPVSQQEQVRVQLSTSLIAVLSQQLCARADKPGRCAAYEFLVVTPAISNLIRENKTFRIDSAIQTGRKFGMQLLDDHLWKLYSEGKVSAEEIIDKCKNPGDMKDKIHRAGGVIGRTELDSDHEAG